MSDGFGGEPAGSTLASPGTSRRVGAAAQQAQARHRRQIRRIRSLLIPTLALVVAPSMVGRPGPGLHGRHLVVAGCLVAFTGAVVAAISRPARGRVQHRKSLILSLIMGASGVGLVATQISASAELPGTTAVAMAFLQLPLLEALGVGGGVTAAVTVAVVLHGGGDDDAVATVLLCATLALMGVLVRNAGVGQDAAERLMAQLEDAREDQAKAAALAERGRIARDLHDVLAQSLSGLAIQVEAARSIARQDRAGQQLCEVLDRAAALAKDGVADARRAVGALRGDSQPSLELLAGLVERYRVDLRLDVTLAVLGVPRTLAAAAGEALFRGAQEALTNTARYARGSTVRVELRYEESATVLTVEDARAAADSGMADGGPVITGSGLGLRGMTERLEQAGGQMRAGPSESGWRVCMEVPG